MNTFLLSLGGLILAAGAYLLVGRILARRLAERMSGSDFERWVCAVGETMTNVGTTVLLLIVLRAVWRPIKEAHTIGVMVLLVALSFLLSFAVLMLQGVMRSMIQRGEGKED